jgi:HEAT repeat protein
MEHEKELSPLVKGLVYVVIFIAAWLIYIGILSKNYWNLGIGVGILLLAFILWIRSLSRYLDSANLDGIVKSKGIPGLIKLIRKNPSVAKDAKPLLIKRGAEATRLCIIEAEKTKKNMKAYFLDIVANPRDPGGMKHLGNALQNSDKEICLAAIKGLGHLKKPSAVEMLSKQLQAGDSDVVIAAIEALKQIGTPEAELRILGIIERSDEIKIAALKAVRNSRQEQVFQAIKTLWQQSTSRIKTEAAINLCAYRDIDTETLFALLSAHQNQENVLIPVIKALGPRRDQRAYEQLIRFTAEKSDSIAAAAIDALGYYPREETVTHLKKFTEHDNPTILQSVIRALCQIQSKDAIDTVFELFKYWGNRDPSSSYAWERKPKNSDIAKSAIKELGKINDPQVVGLLASIVIYANYDYFKKDIERILKKQKKSLPAAKHGEILKQINSHFAFQAARKKSKTGSWLGEKANEAKLPAYGTCITCEKRIPLSNAKYRTWEWDRHYAHPYYCPNCFDKRNIYLGALKDEKGEDIILQVPKEE